MKRIKVVPVAQLNDNYAYLIIDNESHVAAAVDVSEADKVLLALTALYPPPPRITHVLTTHHHGDHCDGNKALKAHDASLVFVGGDDRIPELTHKVEDGEKVMVGRITIESIFAPCHTRGHFLFYCRPDGDEPGHLFTGDTLFSGGCGAFFEGTPDQMHYALIDVIAKLPPDTRVWCGHEYTLANLQFALTIDGDNQVLRAKFERVLEQRRRGEQTVPSTVAEELQFNPFMRVGAKAIKLAVGSADDTDIETMGKVRATKNKYKAPALL